MHMECDICGKEIDKLELGMLSWQEAEGVIKNFTIHHKHTCEVKENEEWIPLYLMYNPKVFCNWIMLMFKEWNKKKKIKGIKKLEKIIITLYAANMRELTEAEKRDWIGYTNRMLPLNFPGE